jgi:hypothetical protein
VWVITMVYEIRDYWIFLLLSAWGRKQIQFRKRCVFKLLDDDQAQKLDNCESNDIIWNDHSFKNNLIDLQSILHDHTVIVMTPPLPSDWQGYPFSLLSNEWRRLFGAENAWNCNDLPWLDVMVHIPIRVLLLPSITEQPPASDKIPYRSFVGLRHCLP